jgi:hypothetical protein
MALMSDDIDHPMILIRDALEHPDTGFVPVPAELVSTKEAAFRRGLSERTMQRRAENLGIAIKIGKTWFLASSGLNALPTNDTGTLDDVRHDMQLISRLTGCPISPSTIAETQIIPAAWDKSDPKESGMQAGFAPSQRYPESVKLRLPQGMSAALQFAARRRAQSLSDWTRQALLDRLHQEGLILTDTGTIRRSEEV